MYGQVTSTMVSTPWVKGSKANALMLVKETVDS